MPEINFFWDPLSDNILQERDETGLVTAEYTAEPGLYGNVISQNRSGVESQFHYDGQGSTIAVTDDNQNVTDTFAYTAFGEVTERTGTTAVPFQYIGQKGYYTDSLTGQIMARRRPYEPARGRWMSVDPLFLLRVSLRYSYASNNPGVNVDPSGKLTISVVEAYTTTDCGPGIAAGFLYDFALDKAPGCNGFFVQMIDLQEESQACTICDPCPTKAMIPKTLRPTRKPYWEAWHVTDPNTKEDHRVPVIPLELRTFTDADARKVEDADCGFRVTRGTVKFFCDTVTGDLGKDKTWPTDNPDTEAGELPSTTSKPPWWDDKPLEGPATRFTGIWWCCCTDPTLCEDGKNQARAQSNPPK